jgi:hypothetical protein
LFLNNKLECDAPRAHSDKEKNGKECEEIK